MKSNQAMILVAIAAAATVGALHIQVQQVIALDNSHSHDGQDQGHGATPINRNQVLNEGRRDGSPHMQS